MLRRKRTPFSEISDQSGAVWYASRVGRLKEGQRTVRNGVDVRGLPYWLVSLETAF